MAIKLRSYQTPAVQEIYKHWRTGVKNVLLQLPTGGGKCLGRDTDILMFNGEIKKVQDIVVGDFLMGPDSVPRHVLSTTKGQSELFKIVPIKGEPWICNDVHVLSLRHTQTKEIIDIPLDDYLKKSKDFKHLHKQFRTGVNFWSQPVPEDPYLLGVYLAEGTHNQPSITNPDKEIVRYCENWATKNNMKINKIRGKGCWTLWFSDFQTGWHKNRIRNLAKSCCSREDRWIPKSYLINSRCTRLELLAGLLDGDGHLHHGGFEIITKYPSLNRDILYLARSLGFAAYSKISKKTIKSTGFSGNYFRIVISGETHLIPTKVKRKKASVRKQIKNVLNTGFSVESIGEGEYFGFELDGDGRFLLGDFTVTHNTKTFCSIAIDLALKNHFGQNLPTAIMVHRKELVQQICLTLAEEEIPHNIIAPRPVIMGIVAAQRQLLRKQFYDYNAPITVISVDTLNSRILKHEKWAKSIRLWITDEAAHLLKENKWGRAVSYFKEAIGLGVTATPERLDKRGLGAHVDGVFDVMVEGPSTRWLIENGYLCKYKIAIPESDYRAHLKEASDGSDYSKEAMAFASERSHIVGDIVANYLKFAKGKQAIVFASDIGAATRIEKKFLENGVSAKSLNSNTPDDVRLKALVDYRDKKIQVLINVDLFDEGLDVPGIEVVIMGRPTKSLGKFLQMCGRGLRPVYANGFDLDTLEGRHAAQAAGSKPYMLLIDHVGNVKEHGLPDSRRRWSLDRVVKRRKKINLIRICANWQCNSPFDRLLSECPYCGHKDSKGSREGGGRVSPAQVDGDLVLLDPDTLRELEANSKLEDPGLVAARVAKAAGGDAAMRAMKNQVERIETQKKLAEIIAHWAGRMRQKHGLTDRMIHKEFYKEHDMTIWEVLGRPKSEMIEVMEELQRGLE